MVSRATVESIAKRLEEIETALRGQRMHVIKAYEDDVAGPERIKRRLIEQGTAYDSDLWVILRTFYEPSPGVEPEPIRPAELLYSQGAVS